MRCLGFLDAFLSTTWTYSAGMSNEMPKMDTLSISVRDVGLS